MKRVLRDLLFGLCAGLVIACLLSLCGCAAADVTDARRPAGQAVLWALCCLGAGIIGVHAVIAVAHIRLLRGGIGMIALERQRQTEAEGHTPQHDAGHVRGELAWAAACYAAPAPISHPGTFLDPWPWDARADKRGHHDRIRELVKAGALCAAEIDRLLKARGGQLLGLVLVFLCSCSRKEAAAFIRSHDVAIAWYGFTLCASVAAWTIVVGTREAWRRRRETEKYLAEADAQRRELAPIGSAACNAFSAALDGDWSDAHRALSGVPPGERRDTLKCAISLLEQHARAEELVRTWLDRAERCADSDGDELRDRREVTLFVASELADALGIPISQHLCRHPFRDAKHCGTCGEDVPAAEVDNGP